MAEYPKQETASRATIARRERVTIHRDAAAGGASQPSYTQLLGASVPAEILQVAGGEVVRGRQVESHTRYVVSIGYLPGMSLDARCKIAVLSGVYTGLDIYTHRVHYETSRGRPVAIQLHGKSDEL
jgi:hypothetical protein